MFSKVVAIDGPSGSGKSSAARLLAQRLGFFYVDSGATYRALALSAAQEGADLNDPQVLENFLDSFHLRYSPSPEVLVEVSGVDLTQAIRRHEVSALASAASTLPRVREFLVSFQRSLAPSEGCVMEGRDIGTVVFPDAFAKFFVTASSQVRAKRRWRDVQGVDLERVMKDEKERDRMDTGRAYDPLVQAEGAIVLDTSQMDLQRVTDILESHCRKCAQEVGLSL